MIIEQFTIAQFTLVETGVDTQLIFGDDHRGRLIPVRYWMKFRSPLKQEITIYRDRLEELPKVQLGATHWFRMCEEVQ